LESLEPAFVVSHISRKTSEMWGTQDLFGVCENAKEKPQIPRHAGAGSPLRCAPPGFPVELGGVGALHAAFLNESSTRGNVQRSVAGNPGPVEMTILFESGIPCFHEMSAELQIPRLRSG
jgi:hypothetical protein